MSRKSGNNLSKLVILIPFLLWGVFMQAQAPVANFATVSNSTSGCAPLYVAFVDQSTGSPTSWSWDFGNGQLSTVQNPTASYSQPGTYTVRLIVKNADGIDDEIKTNYITIFPSPKASFTANLTTSCAPGTIQFSDQSTTPPGSSITAWSWDFGDGTTSAQQNPSHIYTNTGFYNVALQVTSSTGCKNTMTIGRFIRIVSGVDVDFAFSQPSTCKAPFMINFQDQSSGPGTLSYSWNFGNGTTSTLKNPATTYATAGTYAVKLTVQSNLGCNGSTTKNIVVAGKTTNFSFPSTICIGQTVNFQNSSSPAPIASSWSFSDGTTSSQINPVKTFLTAGTYKVKLINNYGNCSDSITKNVTVISSPTVKFSVNDSVSCTAPFTAQFTDQSPGATAWFWDFGDSTTSTQQNPTHTYNNPGFYDVTLNITLAGGCSNALTKIQYIKIKPMTVSISNAPAGGCIPFTYSPVPVVQSIDSIASYAWDLGEPGAIYNTQFPTHTYNSAGNYNIQLTVTTVGGCTQTISIPNGVRTGTPPTADFTTSSVQNPVHSYPALTTYTVTLTVTNGACSYPLSKTITLINEPADFVATKNPVCKNEYFGLGAINSNPANIQSYMWTIGATTINNAGRGISHSFSTYGSYDVSLTIVDTNGCITSKTVPNYMTVTGPVANFSAAGPGGCINKQINFNDLSTPASKPITQWTWNFGDGTIQSFNAPPFSHTYLQPGNYSVSLTVKDNGNCSDMSSLSNVVLITNPIAAFKADTLYCPLAPLQFVDTSTGLGLTYNWNFGDGGNSTLQNPTHSYSSGNNSYTIKLKIKDLVGCEDSVTKNSYINIRTPKSAFDMVDSSGICLPLVTSFTFKGTDYKSFSWDFGDGATTTAQNPTHFYNSYGVYKPKLYVIGPGGCKDSSQATVTAYNPGTDTHIVFGPTTACNSLTVNFDISAPPGFKYNLYFGDGVIDSSDQPNLSHLYASPGNYSAFLVFTDQFGCQPSVPVGAIHVYGALPLFDKSRKEFCDSGQVSFKNYTLSNDPITSTTWDFGDGSTSTAITPSHFFASPGMYIVKLIVTTQNGCTSIYSDTIHVYNTPEVVISGKDTICLNSTENFSGLLSLQDSTVSWQWGFGNGTSSQIQNPSVLYSAVGDYNIQLIGINKLGCADTATHTVTVVPLPTADPVSNPLTIISGTSAQINMNYTGPVVSYNWLPVQNLDCTDCPQPIANPRVTTDYHVQIQDRYGCKNSGNVTVKVICNGQNFFIPNTFSPNGDGVNDVFYLRGTGLFRVNSMMIFNRWGEVVFEKKNFPVNDALSGWDGNYKGKKAKPDVYIYEVEIVCDNGEIMKYSGNIALIQ